jgi:hypothetical protein
MDGQQRLTSLFQSLRSGMPVETKDNRGKDITRWYYVNISQALNDLASREDAIVSVPADRKVLEGGRRKVVMDLTTQEAECAAGMFPLRLSLDQSAVNAWLRDFVAANTDGWGIWDKFQPRVLENIQKYQLPVIRLAAETPKEAVCTVFEKVNTGGVPLNVFELLTATYAADGKYFDTHGHDFQLLEHWLEVREQIVRHAVFSSPKGDKDTDFKDTDFLQAVCLVSTHYRRRGRSDTDPFTQPAASCKRGDILDLPLEE